MIDLHCHTTNSDGTWTVEELLKKAQEINLEVLSITDHDSVKSYFEIQKNRELQNVFKGKIINGVELNCVFDGIKIEALAYDFDIFDENDGLAQRGSFIIDPEGKIVVYEVNAGNVGRNADELLRRLHACQFVYEHGDNVCPAKWKLGEKTIQTTIENIGK